MGGLAPLCMLRKLIVLYYMAILLANLLSSCGRSECVEDMEPMIGRVLGVGGYHF